MRTLCLEARAEPNLRQGAPRAGDPDGLVWLTENASSKVEGTHDWASFNEKYPMIARKTVVRFTVEGEVSRRDPRTSPGLLYRWDWWYGCRDGDRGAWRRAIERSGGDWRSWLVSEASIHSSAWERVERLDTQEVLWTRAEGLTEAGRRTLEELAPIVEKAGVVEFRHNSEAGRDMWREVQPAGGI